MMRKTSEFQIQNLITFRRRNRNDLVSYPSTYHFRQFPGEWFLSVIRSDNDMTHSFSLCITQRKRASQSIRLLWRRIHWKESITWVEGVRIRREAPESPESLGILNPRVFWIPKNLKSHYFQLYNYYEIARSLVYSTAIYLTAQLIVFTLVWLFVAEILFPTEFPKLLFFNNLVIKFLSPYHNW